MNTKPWREFWDDGSLRVGRSCWPNGNMENETHFIKNSKYYKDFHREDGPAFTRWWKNGNLHTEDYYVDGVCHRTDGAAMNRYYESGKIRIQEYVVDGKTHREAGPAIIWWNENGEIDNQVFYLNNREVTAYEAMGDTPEYMFYVLQNAHKEK